MAMGQKMMNGGSTADAVNSQPQRPPVEDPAGGDNREPASEEEQAAYNRYVEAGMEIIYPADGGVNPVILKTLQAEPYPEEVAQTFANADPPLRDHPVDALAAAAVYVVLQIEDVAEEAGPEIVDEIVMNGGKELLEQLADISVDANFHDYPEKDLEGAWFRAVDLYRVTSQRVDQEQLKNDFGAIVDADQKGQLDQLLPGLSEYAAKTEKSAPAEEQA